MLKSLRYALLIALCLFATACDLSSKSGTSVASTATPSPTPGPNGCTDPQPSSYGYFGRLNDITMLSPSDGWAVGDGYFATRSQSLILHFDGHRWTSVPSPTNANLNRVQMISPAEGWAIGTGPHLRGVILHYVNGSWSISYNAANTIGDSGPALESLTFLGPNDGLAVGGYAVNSSTHSVGAMIIHYNGNKWQPTDNSASALNGLNLEDVSLAASHEGWAVGYYAVGTGGAGVSLGRMVHYKNGAWLPPTGAELSVTDLIDNWTSVKLISPTEGWATGYTRDSQKNQIPSLWHLHEGHWAAVGESSGVTRLGLVSPTEWWGVGYGFCHYKDGKFTSVIPADAARASLSAVSMISATEGWAVGGCFQSGQCEIWHYLNGTWSAYTDQ